MDIGEPRRTWNVEPIEDPVPLELPEIEPEPDPARSEPEPVSD
jgi:hypothetical protein